MHPTRVLIIRFSSMGDIVLTTPVIRYIKEQFDGEVEIHFLTKKNFVSLLEHNPHIRQIHAMEKSVMEVVPELMALDFDYIIDLHSNIRSRIVKRKLKRLAFTFDKLNFKKWLWVNFGINKMPNVHIVDRYLATLSAFGVQDDGKGLDYFLPQNFSWNHPTLPSQYVAFAIGGAHIGKRMDAAKLISICKEIHHPVVLLGGKEDVETAEQITAQLPQVKDYCGKLSIHESAYVLKEASVVISGDTGLMHIASAFQKKIISLWGCTTPGLGMYPYRPHPASVILEPHGRTKRPCSKLGNNCKYGEKDRCILHIDEAELIQSIEKLWVLEKAPSTL
jgi:ADP-heptose:LPS heptosyltransferase